MLKQYKYPEGSLISFMSNLVKTSGGINLAQGIPSFEPPMELKSILSNLAFESVHQYPPGTGDIELVKQILNHYRLINQNLRNENLLITQGATEAICLIYQYLKTIIKDRFGVLAFDPLYESYKYLPEIMGDNLIVEKLDAIYDIDYLTETIESNNIKLVFVSSPGNPYGKAMKKEDVERLVDLAEKHGCYIIFDAVYKDLFFNEVPYIPINNLSQKVFYVNSFSKMLSITGWRIGYFFCNAEHMKKIRSIHDYTGLCAPSILQKAIAQYLKDYNYGEVYLEEIRRKLKTSYETLSIALRKVGFQMPEIDGGYFIWAKLPDNYPDGFQWAMNLYERYKVAVIPGVHFSKNGERYIRFNLARTESEIFEAIDRISKFSGELKNI